MIEFSCQRCGKRFRVSRELAGRRGTCKHCRGPIVVPLPTPEGLTSSQSVSNGAAQSTADRMVVSFSNSGNQGIDKGMSSQIPMQPQVPPRVPMRIRRLLADHDQVVRAFQGFSLIQLLSAEGNPPERYIVQYNVKGLVRDTHGNPVPQLRHVVEIVLTSEYPRQSPKCKMLTAVFHPNIEPAAICVGDHWTAGERLSDLIVRIGEMLAFQAYNIKSPLDGEAAMWTDLNRHRLPVDERELRPPE